MPVCVGVVLLSSFFSKTSSNFALSFDKLISFFGRESNINGNIMGFG
jgi:hypothetical protein